MTSPSLPRPPMDRLLQDKGHAQQNQPRQGSKPDASRRALTPPLFCGTPPHTQSRSLTPPVSFNDQKAGCPGAPQLEFGARADATQSGQSGESEHLKKLNGLMEKSYRFQGETQLSQQDSIAVARLSQSHSRGSLHEDWSPSGGSLHDPSAMLALAQEISEGGRSRSNSSFLSKVSGLSSRQSGTGTSLTGSSTSRGRLQGRHAHSQGTPESRTPQRQVSDGPKSSTPLTAFSEASTDQRMMAMLEMLADCNFHVRSDEFITTGSKVLSVLFLACSIIFACFALQADRAYKLRDNAGPIGYVAGALVFSLMALCTFLRVRSPTSLNIARVNGDWCFILHRMAMKPVVRPLRTLEAFVETFGFGSRAQLGFWGKMFGHATSRKGTVHLFFPESASSTKAMAISLSLENPKAFFMRLRDLMIPTSHHLSAITADYVTDWEQESRADDECPESARDAVV